MKRKNNLRYFAIPNLNRYQHYQDGSRTPHWCKFHFSAFNDFDFCELPDSAKYHFVALCALALRHGNRVPYSAPWVSSQIGATEQVDLDALLAAGWIEMIEFDDEEIQYETVLYIPNKKGVSL